MSPALVGTIALVVAFLFVFIRMPIGLAFASMGFLGLWFLKGFGPAVTVLKTVPYTAMTMYVWTVIPLFVFMGYLAQHTRLAQDFYEGVRRWVGHFRGGLATAVVLGNTAFGACTGDSISSSITFLTMSLPEMRKYGYNDRLTLGSVAGGCQLAVLIPPSLPFILYGAVTNVSIGKLFMAGMIPGLILTVLYIGVISFLCFQNRSLGPPGPQTTLREKFGAAKGMWAIMILFIVIIGGIYMGLFSPTEAGAAGAFVVFILGLISRRLNWKIFVTALKDTGRTVPVIGLLVIGSQIFNRLLVMSGLPSTVASVLGGMTTSPVVFLFITLAVFIVLGAFLDSLSLTLIMVPILHPIAVAMGIDPIHYGTLFVIVLAMGTLTPPYGIVVYAMSGAAKDISIFTIFRGVMPFIVAMLILAILVIFFPQIALFLPNNMMG